MNSKQKVPLTHRQTLAMDFICPASIVTKSFDAAL